MQFFSLSIILLGLLAANADAATQKSTKICYVSAPSSNLLPSAKDFKDQHSGFRSAILAFNKQHHSQVFFDVWQSQASNDSVLTGIQWARDQKCQAVVGLVSSRDALTAAPLLKEFGIFGISSTATTDDLDKYFPYVMSASSSVLGTVQAIRSYMNEQKLTTMFVVGDKSDLFSNFWFQALKASKVEHDSVLVDSNGNLIDADLKRLQKNSPEILMFSLYPLVSIKPLAQLSKLKLPKTTLILGNPSWMETHAFAARKDLFLDLPPLFAFSPWALNRPSPKFERLREFTQKTFGVEPDHDSAYDYDVANMLLGCVANSSSTEVSSAEFRKCFSSGMRYSGVTGDYKFTERRSHPNRVETIVPINFDGMIPPREKHQ